MIRNEAIFEISFEKSDSIYYSEALKILENFDKTEFSSENSSLHKIRFSLKELRDCLKEIDRLWTITSDWKETFFSVNGSKVSAEVTRNIIRTLRCSLSRDSSSNVQKYCSSSSNTGCLLLDGIETNPVSELWSYYNKSRRYWFDFGFFLNSDNWKIDKKELKKEIIRESDQRVLKYCPYFEIERAFRYIDNEIPGSIDISNPKEWEVYESGGKKRILPKRSPERIENDNIRQRNIPRTRFSDIGGVDEVIETIREIIELPLKKPELFHFLGIKPHRGVLLYGPPGCGKTMIARAIANEIKAHFIPIKGPELLNKFLGQSEENLRKVFQEAFEKQPSIIYFDEIDAIAQKRSGEETLRSESRFVTQLLTLMDGIDDFGDVCVIASTNKEEVLDQALLRPGRFDYSIKINIPSKQGCFDIFRLKTMNMPLDRKIDIFRFSEKLYGLSGAEIDFIAREAAYNCLRRNVDLKSCITEGNNYSINYQNLLINLHDLERALLKVSRS